MMEILPLKGIKALRALNAFSALLLGIKMLPAYLQISMEVFYESFKEKSEAQKETILREAVAFVRLESDEVEAIITFCKDRNGVPYSASNLANLSLDEMHEIIVAVCMEIGRMKITLVSEEEKKNLKDI